MRTAPLNFAAALCLAVAASLCFAGCSYDSISAPLTFEVKGIPNGAIHLDATLTDAANKITEVHPSFGADAYSADQPLMMAFPAPASGTLSIAIQAFDQSRNVVAAYTGTGDFSGSPLDLPVTLVPSVISGTFGQPCLSGGVCASSLTCKHYAQTDSGICTNVCSGPGAGDCANAPQPQAQCSVFPNTTGSTDTFCQWDCGGGQGPCPPGTVCSKASNGTFDCVGP